MRVEEMLAGAAAEVPSKVALVSAGRRISYAEFKAEATNLAAAFGRLGVRPGDRVAIVAENSIEAAVSIFAVWKAGAVIVPLHPASKPATLAAIFNSIQPAVIVAGARQLPAVQQAIQALSSAPVLVVVGSAEPVQGVLEFSRLAAVGASSPQVPSTNADDLATLIHTSGSTGHPKGVMLHHCAMMTVLDAVADRLGARSDDVILSALPFAFSYGLYQLLMTIRTRATLVLEQSFAFPQIVFDRIRNEGVTAIPLVPTTIATLLNNEGFTAAALPTLRYITSASAPLAADQVTKLAARLPAVDIHIMYGQSECKRIAMLPPHCLTAKPGSVGIALPGTDAFVADPEGRPLPAGETGELVVRGPHLMRGYWNDADATAVALRPDPDGDGRLLFTGDLFRSDAEGYLYFVARKDDIIKTRGEKVAPAEVEAALLSCSGVLEALVFPKPDAVLGQAVHALVVVSDLSLVERDLQRACARLLEDFKVPRSISIRADLPRTANGKASRKLAAEMN